MICPKCMAYMLDKVIKGVKWKKCPSCAYTIKKPLRES